MTIQSKSLTHVHIYNCIATIVQSIKTDAPIKVLDAGCGNGELISYLYRSFQENFPLLKIDIYGFDVIDHGVQSSGYGGKTLAMLEEQLKLRKYTVAVEADIEVVRRRCVFKVSESWP